MIVFRRWISERSANNGFMEDGKNKYFWMIMRADFFPFGQILRKCWIRPQDDPRRRLATRQASHCGISEMSIIHTSARGSVVATRARIDTRVLVLALSQSQCV